MTKRDRIKEALRPVVLRQVRRVMESKLLREFFTDDKKFEVYGSRLKAFLSKVAETKTLKVTNKVKDGGYYTVTVFNSGPAENWDSLVDFYKSSIKI